MIKTGLAVSMLLIASGALAQGKIQTLDQIDPDSVRQEHDRNPVHTVVPEYPQKALLERVEGDVQVCFRVNRGGRPYRIAVRRSDNRIFERPARDAVKKSWFEAIPRPKDVPQVKTCRTFMFRLEPVPIDELEVDSAT
jgi:TonB family protein